MKSQFLLTKTYIFIEENDCSVNLIVSLRVSTLCNPKYAGDINMFAKLQLEVVSNQKKGWGNNHQHSLKALQKLFKQFNMT